MASNVVRPVKKDQYAGLGAGIGAGIGMGISPSGGRWL
jgi:hypothetical protein